MTNEVWTTPRIAAEIGKTVGKTLAYVDRGLISPSVQEARGHGSKRLWSTADLHRFRIICALEEMGFTVKAMREIMAHIDMDRMEDKCAILCMARKRNPSCWITLTIIGIGHNP